MAERSEPSALIVAHGSPSASEAQEQAIRALASEVATFLPGWQVRGATLALKGSLERSAGELGAPLVYPFFMARGWFTNTLLKSKTTKLGIDQMQPFGLEPELVGIAATGVAEALRERQWQPQDTTLFLAAHGSKGCETSAADAEAFATALSQQVGLAGYACGYIDQEPYLQDAAVGLGQAICLPFFALDAGHVTMDIPKALAVAGFKGIVLPPFIQWPQIRQLIARSLTATHSTARDGRMLA